MYILIAGPGRIGRALVPMLEAAGHAVEVLSRDEVGDFLDAHYDPGAAVERVEACDALLLLAGRFELNAPVEKMGQENATGPLRIAEAVHARFPEAQVVTFLDARVWRRPEGLPVALRSYMAAKRRLAQWTLAAARVWGEACGTRVNGIAPGPVLPPPDRAHSEKGGKCLTPRPTVEDVFRAVCFLLETPSVTGQILYVAAGQQLLGRA